MCTCSAHALRTATGLSKDGHPIGLRCPPQWTRGIGRPATGVRQVVLLSVKRDAARSYRVLGAPGAAPTEWQVVRGGFMTGLRSPHRNSQATPTKRPQLRAIPPTPSPMHHPRAKPSHHIVILPTPSPPFQPTLCFALQIPLPYPHTAPPTSAHVIPPYPTPLAHSPYRGHQVMPPCHIPMPHHVAHPHIPHSYDLYSRVLQPIPKVLPEITSKRGC